jgi:CheY-like chemotaxis protein
MGVHLDRIRVLIVDDNHHMINIVRTILRGFGIKDTLEARDASEAFELFRSSAVDLVIVDYQMDFMDGLDFIRLVRTAKDSRHALVPIIMLTAHSERKRVESARDAGVTEFCCKPITAFELYRKVAAVVNHNRPFISAPNFKGPDRRRRVNPDFQGPERRASPPESTP